MLIRLLLVSGCSIKLLFLLWWMWICLFFRCVCSWLLSGICISLLLLKVRLFISLVVVVYWL